MQIRTSTLLKIPLVSERPTSLQRTYPLLSSEKDREKEKEKIYKKRGESGDFLIRLHGSFNLTFFPRGAAFLNLSEFKFNEKYPSSEKSVASCRDGCFGNRQHLRQKARQAPRLKVRM